jgi:hypothetical protein
MEIIILINFSYLMHGIALFNLNLSADHNNKINVVSIALYNTDRPQPQTYNVSCIDLDQLWIFAFAKHSLL